MNREYIKSPILYTGNKFKILDQILPIIEHDVPEDYTFVDAMCGSGNVGVNSKFKNIVLNDSNEFVVNMLYWINYDMRALDRVRSIIRRYSLSKENKDGYLKLREHYNKDRNIVKLFVLSCYSFNHFVRFNKNSEFNVPFGNRQLSNENIENFTKFSNLIRHKNCDFCNQNYNEITVSSDKILYYFDLPYLGSDATYNENNGWNDEKERALLTYLDNLNERGIRFALSNNLKYKNDVLEAWIKGSTYKIHEIKRDYSNCSHNKKDRSKDLEVLITNY